MLLLGGQAVEFDLVNNLLHVAGSRFDEVHQLKVHFKLLQVVNSTWKRMSPLLRSE